LHGNTLVNPPSRFLADIPESLWSESGVAPRAYLRREFLPGSGPTLTPWDSVKEEPKGPVSQAFQRGDRVRHKHFGSGVVRSSTLTSDDEEVEVEFSTPKGKVLKKLLVSFAGLEAIE
jgi:DNA helicase-2/ATP-dependent DNA helicase PcrA